MSVRTSLLTIAALALALVAAPVAASDPSEARLPARGVLVPGKSLGGIRIGDSAAAVEARWGKSYTRCAVCRRSTWLFSYPGAVGSGAAVSFRRGKVVAVFTLGVPRGWRTTRGIVLGDPTEKLLGSFDHLRWRRCLGYGALSEQGAGVVTSIYTFGEYVYGFALTHSSVSVCQ